MREKKELRLEGAFTVVARVMKLQPVLLSFYYCPLFVVNVKEKSNISLEMGLWINGEIHRLAELREGE